MSLYCHNNKYQFKVPSSLPSDTTLAGLCGPFDVLLDNPSDECISVATDKNLGKDWLGCLWGSPESSFSCICPEYGTKFPSYLKLRQNDIYNKQISKLQQQEPAKDVVTIIKEKIDDIVTNSGTIYRGVRNRARSSEMSELLIYLSIFLRKNILFEIAGFYEDYIKQIFNVIKYSNYIPIFVYPFTPYSSLIYNRTIDRGIREGRFLKCDGEYGIAKMMPILLDGYEKIKEHIKEKFKDKQYLILQYVSIFQAEIDSLKHKYIVPEYIKSQEIMEYILQKVNKDSQIISENKKNINYEEIIKNIKTNCEIDKEFKLK